MLTSQNPSWTIGPERKNWPFSHRQRVSDEGPIATQMVPLLSIPSVSSYEPLGERFQNFVPNEALEMRW